MEVRIEEKKRKEKMEKIKKMRKELREGGKVKEEN